VPKLSIIIPVYNTSAFLPECLESVRAQSFRDFEAILVDDGSTDGSGAICDSFAASDSRFRVIHKHNGGLSAARNSALEVAVGEYVAFVDSDDWLDPLCYETILRAFDSQPASGMVCFSYVCHLVERGEVVPVPVENIPSASYLDKLAYMARGEGHLLYWVWNKVFIRSVIEENHLRFRESVSILEDRLFISQYSACISEAAVIPFAGYHYRMRSGTNSYSAIKDVGEFMRVTRDSFSSLGFASGHKALFEMAAGALVTSFRTGVYAAYDRDHRGLYCKSQRRSWLDEYLRLLSEYPFVRVTHNRHSVLRNSVHRFVWATRCRPLIEAFLRLG
jgi:Glycosyltransferases involved in cell wall biogenesis